MRKNRVWLVFLGCMFFYGALMGVQYNCSGVLISGIMSAEGYSSSSLSGFFTLRNTFQAVAMLFTAQFLRRYDIRLVSFAAGAASAASLLLMVLYHSPRMWLLSGFLAGMGNSLSMLLPTSVINAWFTKRKGTFLGFVTMLSGVLGMLLNPVVSHYIRVHGWRSAAVLLGCLSLGLHLLASLLLAKRPEDVGAEPYGGFDPEIKLSDVRTNTRLLDGGITLHELKVYLFILLSVSMTSKGIQMASYIPQYSTSLGYPLEVGGRLTSAIMIGNFSAKFLFGIICDWLGAWRSTQVFLAIIGLSFFLLSAFGGVIPVMYLACVLLGFSYMSGLALSMVAVELFDREHFETQFSRNSMFSTLVTIPLPYLISKVFDMTGSFRLIFLTFAFLLWLGILLISLRHRLGISGKSPSEPG